jgi:hypothetical protein
MTLAHGQHILLRIPCRTDPFAERPIRPIRFCEPSIVIVGLFFLSGKLYEARLEFGGGVLCASIAAHNAWCGVSASRLESSFSTFRPDRTARQRRIPPSYRQLVGILESDTTLTGGCYLRDGVVLCLTASGVTPRCGAKMTSSRMCRN